MKSHKHAQYRYKPKLTPSPKPVTGSWEYLIFPIHPQSNHLLVFKRKAKDHRVKSSSSS